MREKENYQAQLHVPALTMSSGNSQEIYISSISIIVLIK